jgi:hypothetical protein
MSFTTSIARTHAWSVFSGLSLSAVSIISVIALPLSDEELSEWYRPATLHVNSLMGHSFKLHVNWTDTIGSVKARIWKKTSIPIFQQRLVFRDQVLKNEERLTHYDIPYGSQINLQPLSGSNWQWANIKMPNGHEFSLAFYSRPWTSQTRKLNDIYRRISNWTGILDYGTLRLDNSVVAGDPTRQYVLAVEGSNAPTALFRHDADCSGDADCLCDSIPVNCTSPMSRVLIRQIGLESRVMLEVDALTSECIKKKIEEAKGIRPECQYLFWRDELCSLGSIISDIDSNKTWHNYCGPEFRQCWISLVYTFPGIVWSQRECVKIQSSSSLPSKCSHCSSCSKHPDFVCLYNFRNHSRRPSCHVICNEWTEVPSHKDLDLVAKETEGEDPVHTSSERGEQLDPLFSHKENVEVSRLDQDQGLNSATEETLKESLEKSKADLGECVGTTVEGSVASYTATEGPDGPIFNLYTWFPDSQSITEGKGDNEKQEAAVTHDKSPGLRIGIDQEDSTDHGRIERAQSVSLAVGDDRYKAEGKSRFGRRQNPGPPSFPYVTRSKEEHYASLIPVGCDYQ